MLTEVDTSTYNKHFQVNPNPFISEAFIELNKSKADRVVRLIDDNGKSIMG